MARKPKTKASKVTRKKRKNTDHSAAFIVGSLLGGLTGAAIALWKTPQPGSELRAQLSGALGMGNGQPARETETIAIIEPSPPTTISAGPSQEARVAYAMGSETNATDAEPPPTGIGHAASTEELTTPPHTQPA